MMLMPWLIKFGNIYPIILANSLTTFSPLITLLCLDNPLVNRKNSLKLSKKNPLAFLLNLGFCGVEADLRVCPLWAHPRVRPYEWCEPPKILKTHNCLEGDREDR